MDFTLPAEIEDYRAKVRAFVDEHIIPLEADRANYDAHDNIAPDILKKTQEKVKVAGFTRTALIIVGRVLNPEAFDDSRLYAPDHHHVLRPLKT